VEEKGGSELGFLINKPFYNIMAFVVPVGWWGHLLALEYSIWNCI
jgi:hypothetical protein